MPELRPARHRTQLNIVIVIVVDPNGDIELAPANNTITLNLTNCRLCVLGANGPSVTLKNTTGVATDGDIAVNSSAANAIDLQNSTLQATTGEIRVTGAVTSTGSTTTPAPITKPPVSDPTASLVVPTAPTPGTASCTIAGGASACGVATTTTANGTISLVDGSLVTLTVVNKPVEIGPGRYGSIELRGNSALTLRPGIYFVDNLISLSGNVTMGGTGVTLFVTGNVSLTGGAKLELSSPNATVPAIAMTRTTPQTIDLKGNSTLNISGSLFGRTTLLDTVGTVAVTGQTVLNSISGTNSTYRFGP